MPENNNERHEPPKPVVTGKVSTGKKRDLLRQFIEDDASTIFDSVRENIVKPTMKEMAYDAFTAFMKSIIFGYDDGVRSGGGYTRRSGGYDYNSRYRSRSNYESSRSRQAGSPRSRYDVDEILFDNRADADAVLDILCEELDRYNQVSVGDFYSACDLSPNAGDFNYGWFDLRNARIEPRRGAWVMVLPRPVEL